MKQKRKYQKGLRFGLALGAFALFASSCIDQLYDLKKGISKSMAIGGDSLSIPIGSTDTIMLGDYLNPETLEMLKVNEEGGFGINIKDSIEPLSISIDQTNLKLADQTIKTEVSVNFGDLDLGSFEIPGVTVQNDVNLGLSNYSLGTFSIPSISSNTSANAGMSGYGLSTPSIADKSFNADKTNLLSGIDLPTDPGGNNPVELPIVDPAPIAVSTEAPLDYAISVPDGVSNISNVELSDGAYLEVVIELAEASSTLNKGTIIPVFDINTDNLFVFNTPPAGGLISFEQKDSLTKSNGYKVTKRYNIKGLNTPSNPSNGTLNISKTMTTSGNMSLKGATVMSNNLGNVGDMDLLVSMSVKDVTIRSMEFDIPKLNSDIPTNTTSLTINNSVPSQINKLNTVLLNNPGTITINLSTENLPPMVSSTIKIENLNIVFPDEFVFQPTNGLNGHTYTITNETFNPATGRTIQLTLNELDMSNIAISNGTFNWSGDITYNGVISFDGRIKSNNIPTSENDTKMNVAFSSDLTFKSADVTTNAIAVDVPKVDIPINFNIDITNQVKRLNSLSLKPNTKITLNIIKPTLPLPLEAKNLVIAFPDLFVFDPPLNGPGNNYILNGTMPDSIVLVLDKLNVNSNLDDGKLSLNNVISVNGGVEMKSGTVNSTEIDAMSTKSMTVKAKTSKLGIASTTVELNDLIANFADSTALDIVEDGIPDQLVLLDSILLSDNAQVSISVDIKNMPNLSNPLNANVVIDFPDLLMFSDGVNSRNQLVINEPFIDGKLTKTLGLRGIKFDGNPINGKIDIHKTLKYTAGVSVTSPTVNSDELNGNDIIVSVNADLKNIGFNKIFGILDPKLEPINQEMALGSMPEFLQGEGINLDITKPAIALTTESNLGLPIIASVKVTPIVNGTENTSVEQSFNLNIPKTATPDNPQKNNFWIAPDSAGMPSGYEFILTNIQDLFKTIPSGVNLNASVVADESVQHNFDLSKTYLFKLGYNVSIPFAFGEDMLITIPLKIENIDPSIGEMAASVKGIEILGEIINSIPLELQLALVPLDADGNRIPIDTVFQTIDAGAYDGSASTSSLTLKLEDPDGLLKELRAFDIILTARSNSTVAGTAIKPENFVKANLKARITGGINIKSFIKD